MIFRGGRKANAMVDKQTIVHYGVFLPQTRNIHISNKNVINHGQVITECCKWLKMQVRCRAPKMQSLGGREQTF